MQQQTHKEVQLMFACDKWAWLNDGRFIATNKPINQYRWHVLVDWKAIKFDARGWWANKKCILDRWISLSMNIVLKIIGQVNASG